MENGGRNGMEIGGRNGMINGARNSMKSGGRNSMTRENGSKSKTGIIFIPAFGIPNQYSDELEA